MIRNEVKFIINPIQKEILVNKLKSICIRDSYCASLDGYKVISLYFDDYNNSSYYDKINGVMHRKKFRIRTYDYDQMQISLEKKIKHGNVCEKQIFPITFDEYKKILEGNIDFLKLYTSSISRDFYFSYTAKGLRPKSVVSYDRDSYIFKYGNVRITFDCNIKSSIKGLDIFSNMAEVKMPDQSNIIMEIKYTEYLPSVIKALIQNSSIMPLAISKYTNTRII